MTADALVVYLAAVLDEHRPAHGARAFCSCGATPAHLGLTWSMHVAGALLDALDNLAGAPS